MFATVSVAQDRGAPPSGIHTYDLCARGLNNDPAKPFTQTLRVKLSLTGPPIDESVRKVVLAQLILTKVWKDRAGQVFVEDFDETDCAASAGNQAVCCASALWIWRIATGGTATE